MRKFRNILSLFDGISICQEALHDQNLDYEICYSSEIDKHASAITRYNYPDTIHLGDVRKWETWDIDWSKIDILFAGFPCQSWSVAGKELGDRDPRGQLMWVMMDIFTHIKKHNPNFLFLFENVKMKTVFMEYCSNAIGIQPILINSSLVSAQNRERYYWTNIFSEKVGMFGDELICRIPQPENKNILLKDILEKSVPEKYTLSEKRMKIVEIGKFKSTDKVENINGKSGCLTAGMGMGGGSVPFINLDEIDENTCGNYNALRGWNFNKDSKSPTLLARARQDVHGLPCVVVKQGTKLGYDIALEGDSINLTFPSSENRRGRVGKEKAQTLDCDIEQYTLQNKKLRRLIPLECERLQTFKDNYTKFGDYGDGKIVEVSDTQRYKSIGNSWTKSVISYILSFTKINYNEWLNQTK